MTSATIPRSSIDPAEVARFSALAGKWWDTGGAFAPLHRLNPVRLGFIREQCLERFGRDARARTPFEALRLLDVGCGGGLLCEPMTRLGFAVTGIDPAAENVAAASAHAADMELSIDYRAVTAEDLLVSADRSFDVILNMEVIEHVAAPGVFLRDCARLLAPGGLMIVATLNRTLKSLALAKIGAEYVLRWAPVGTHDWRRFITPEEIVAFLAGEPYQIAGPFGVAFHPLSGSWRRSPDTGVNYLMTVGRAAL